MAVNFAAIFSAQDRVSRELGNINKKSDALSGTFKKLAGVAAGVFSVAKIIDFGKQSVSAFTTFENGMNEVFTLLPDISDQAMTDMTAQVKDFSKEFGVLPDKTVPALYQALSAGVPKDSVFNFLEVANKAAVGGIASLENSVGVLSTVVNNYGAGMIDAGTASDLLFSTVKKGVTSFPELATAIGDVLPSAATANVAFDQVSAGLATLTATMGKGSTPKAVTSLRSMFDELSNSSSGTSKTFAKLAGKSFPEFMKSGGDINQALAIMGKGADDMGIAVADLFSGIESKKAVNIFTNNSDVLAANLLEMSSSAGATDKAFGRMEEGFARKMEKMKAKLEVLKINVGGKLVDAFLYLWDKAAPIFTAIGDGFEKLKGIFSENGFAGGIEKLFGTEAGEIAKIAENYATAFMGGFKKIFSGDVSGGFTDILSAMGFNDQSIATVMEFVGAIKDSIFKLAGFIGPVIGTIKNAFVSIMPTVQGVMNFFTQTLLPIFQNVFGFIVNNIISPFVAFFQANIPKIANIFNNVWAILQPIFQALAAAFTFVWNIAKPIIDNIVALVTGLGSAIWTTLDGIIQFIAGVFTGNWQSAWDGVVGIFSGIWEGIVAIFKYPINAIINGINSFLRGLNSIKVPDWVPLVGGKGFSIPEIPLLAKGSKSAPNTFIAGERGPELITGAAGSRVFPSDDTGRILTAINNQNEPLKTSYANMPMYDEDGDSGAEKTFNININGEGKIFGNGISKDDVLEILIVHLKPILMKIIQTEIFEEGNLAYDY